jgi:hypothetical protein
MTQEGTDARVMRRYQGAKICRAWPPDIGEECLTVGAVLPHSPMRL